MSNNNVERNPVSGVCVARALGRATVQNFDRYQMKAVSCVPNICLHFWKEGKKLVQIDLI